jgi:hypothetical protein
VRFYLSLPLPYRQVSIRDKAYYPIRVCNTRTTFFLTSVHFTYVSDIL